MTDDAYPLLRNPAPPLTRRYSTVTAPKRFHRHRTSEPASAMNVNALEVV